MCLLKRARKILDMMSDFMCNDIGISEIAISPNPPLHAGEERQIDVDGLISTAVERSAVR